MYTGSEINEIENKKQEKINETKKLLEKSQ